MNHINRLRVSFVGIDRLNKQAGQGNQPMVQPGWLGQIASVLNFRQRPLSLADDPMGDKHLPRSPELQSKALNPGGGALKQIKAQQDVNASDVNSAAFGFKQSSIFHKIAEEKGVVERAGDAVKKTVTSQSKEMREVFSKRLPQAAAVLSGRSIAVPNTVAYGTAGAGVGAVGGNLLARSLTKSKKKRLAGTVGGAGVGALVGALVAANKKDITDALTRKQAADAKTGILPKTPMEAILGLGGATVGGMGADYFSQLMAARRRAIAGLGGVIVGGLGGLIMAKKRTAGLPPKTPA